MIIFTKESCPRLEYNFFYHTLLEYLDSVFFQYFCYLSYHSKFSIKFRGRVPWVMTLLYGLYNADELYLYYKNKEIIIPFQTWIRTTLYPQNGCLFFLLAPKLILCIKKIAKNHYLECMSTPHTKDFINFIVPNAIHYTQTIRAVTLISRVS